MGKRAIDSSILKEVIKKGLALASNLSKMWSLTSRVGKQMLQQLAFPEGITYSKEKDRVRTKGVIKIILAIADWKWDVVKNKQGSSLTNCLVSGSEFFALPFYRLHQTPVFHHISRRSMR